QRGYLQMLLLGRDQAKEVRAFNLAPFLRGRYDELYEQRIAEMRSLTRRRTGRALLGAGSTSLMGAIALGFLAWLYVDGRLDLAAAGPAIFGLQQLASRLQPLPFSTSSLYEATLFTRDSRSFVDAPLPQPREALDPPRPFAGVRAE